MLGPCAFEGSDQCVGLAEALRDLVSPLGRRLVFKCSFDKANRTRGSSFRGAGFDEAMRAFDHVRGEYGIPVVTDIHEAAHCDVVAPHVDTLQIPALLFRQTDLLVAAGRTGRPVNIKKNQFLAPANKAWAMEKVVGAGGTALACERETFFGYDDLVVDFRSIRTMRAMAFPSSSMPLTPCSAPGPVRARPVATGASSTISPAPPSPSASPRCSWRCTTTPGPPNRTARTWSRCTTSSGGCRS